MECKTIKRNISRWIDGELEATQKADIEEHLQRCVSCQKEASAFQALGPFLRQTVAPIEPSRGFDTVFWAKVNDRQRTPWLVKLLDDLEGLIPAPNLRQAAVFATIAFFIGNIGGAVSAMNAGLSEDDSMTSIGQLSKLQEFKGVPSYSLAATYITAAGSGASK